MTPITRPNSIPNHRSKSSHGFGAGLVFGTFIGLTAYYAYGTKTGQKLRQEFVKDFLEEKKLIDEHFAKHVKPVIVEKSTDLKDTFEKTPKPASINRIFGIFTKPISKKQTTTDSPMKSKDTSPKKQKTKKTKPKQHFTRLGKKLTK